MNGQKQFTHLLSSFTQVALLCSRLLTYVRTPHRSDWRVRSIQVLLGTVQRAFPVKFMLFDARSLKSGSAGVSCFCATMDWWNLIVYNVRLIHTNSQLQLPRIFSKYVFKREEELTVFPILFCKEGSLYFVWRGLQAASFHNSLTHLMQDEVYNNTLVQKQLSHIAVKTGSDLCSHHLL